MDDAYKDAMAEHLDQLAEEFTDFAKLLAGNPSPSRVLYRAIERNLQLLVEACIGIAKQTLKGLDRQIPSDSRQVFAKLKALGLDRTNVDWPKIIGMRSALVHHYLNLDPDRILDLIRSGHYRVLFEFANQILKTSDKLP